MFYNKKIDDIYNELETSEKGLNDSEVEKKKEIFGLNVIEEGKKNSMLSIFFAQFNDPMIVILIITALVMYAYGIFYSNDFTDTIVIAVVVLINAIMGFLQERKAEVTLDSLKNYSKSMTTVKRNGGIEVIDSDELVPGDIIMLGAGDKISVDARIIESTNLMVDESTLTGESMAVEKCSNTLKGELQLQDQANMIFSGSCVTNGSVTAVVVSTGMYTEIGKIAKSLNTPYKVETPLERKIKELSKTITFIIFLILIFIFFYSVINKNNVMETIMLCISLAVAAIPEGLPAVITITLSNGTGVLSRKKAVVRQMSAVETLGTIDVICTDKTGTITENNMTIKEINIYNSEMINYIFALCNETIVDKNKYIGDPTEICLYKYLENNKLKPIEIRKNNKRIVLRPFDSDRKMMSSINTINKCDYILVKGSYENILNCCKYIGDEKTKLTGVEIDKIKKEANSMATNALRVMAYAYKKIDKPIKDCDEAISEENNLILAGIAGIIDPPRNSVKNSVKKCIKAGIKPVMITGDSLITACAIAKEVGIIKDEKEGILGAELDKYSDEELLEIIPKYNVFARVSPSHKERIVHTFEALGKVVAMTGDGVNDAPAIKDAHVGVGMGITGTEVTKSVADVILLDDSFSTIVVAIEEGRRIFSNIRNNIVFSLSSNIAEIFIVLVGMFTNNVLLLPIHILFIDLMTDSIPSIALSFEKAEKGIMDKAPRSIDQPLFTPFIISCIVSSAVIETLVSIWVYFVASCLYSHEVACTLVLLSVVIQELIYAITCRNLKQFVKDQGLFSNKAMNIGLIIVILIELLFFITPVGKVIDIASINMEQILMVLIVNVISFAVYELLKPLLVNKFKD